MCDDIEAATDRSHTTRRAFFFCTIGGLAPPSLPLSPRRENAQVERQTLASMAGSYFDKAMTMAGRQAFSHARAHARAHTSRHFAPRKAARVYSQRPSLPTSHTAHNGNGGSDGTVSSGDRACLYSVWLLSREQISHLAHAQARHFPLCFASTILSNMNSIPSPSNLVVLEFGFGCAQSTVAGQTLDSLCHTARTACITCHLALHGGLTLYTCTFLQAQNDTLPKAWQQGRPKCVVCV